MFYHIKTKKKELFLLIFLSALLTMYAGILLFLSINKIFNYWFITGLFLISVYLFAKSVVFRSDSSLYLATLCLCFCVFSVVANYIYFNALLIIAFVFLSFALSHLVLYLVFNKISNFFIFIFNFLLFLPLILYAFYCINLLIMILFICGDIVTFGALYVSEKYE